MNLKRAVRKAYKSTDLYTLRVLQKEASKWQRRKTIATNKLETIEYAIETMAVNLAREKAGVKDESDKDTTNPA